MQKKIWAILFMMMLPMWLFGQSYSELWKKANEAEEKDLPKTQYEVLQKIVAAVRPLATRYCVWCIRRCSIA